MSRSASLTGSSGGRQPRCCPPTSPKGIRTMASDRPRTNLPIPDPQHVGVTTFDAKDPDTAFPPIEPLRPPKGAPNVLLVLLDDVGFAASSAYGGPCEAAVGLVFPLVDSVNLQREVPASSFPTHRGRMTGFVSQSRRSETRCNWGRNTVPQKWEHNRCPEQGRTPTWAFVISLVRTVRPKMAEHSPHLAFVPRSCAALRSVGDSPDVVAAPPGGPASTRLRHSPQSSLLRHTGS